MLATACSNRTRAPIEDGVDGTGVYASRLRSRRSARGPQSPKVLSLVGSTFGAISETEADSTQHLLVFLTNNCTSPAELVADAVPDLSRESVPQRVSMVETGPLSSITCRVCEIDGTLDERLLGDSLRFCYCIDYC